MLLFVCVNVRIHSDLWIVSFSLFHFCILSPSDAATEWTHCEGAALSSLHEAVWDEGRSSEAQRKRRIAGKQLAC